MREGNGDDMQYTGGSEYSEAKENRAPLELRFWKSFSLTLSGAAGLISLVFDGPLWLTYTGGALAIATLIWIIATGKRRQ
jgi:hypothetical protein